MNREIKNIYMIGICGVAMGSLAGMLSRRGYHVSGSDSQVYPPMSVMLKEWDIPVHQGYHERNPGFPDMVIIGNAISRGNPEVEYVLDNRIPYMSLAGALHEFFLFDREVVAVAGTHGKTTTTALLAHILETAGRDPSFLVGGVPLNHGSNFKLGAGPHFVIEADEYDSSFFEKVPKFIFYRPQHLVLTSLEFDHADIYSDLDEIKLWFRRLVNMVPSRGFVLYSGEYPACAEVVREGKTRAHSFGRHGAVSSADFAWEYAGMETGDTGITLHSPERTPLALCTGLFGDFNYGNITAAAAAALMLGVEEEHIVDAVRTFKGVRRRQELIYHEGNIRIYEDFAHHPTAIKAVLIAARGRFPRARVWALYEPRSATSRRNTFQEELPGAFMDADTILVKTPYRLETVPEGERIDIARVMDALARRGKEARLLQSADLMVEEVFSRMDPKAENVIIIMSNGGFDGIYEKIIARARSSKTAS